MQISRPVVAGFLIPTCFALLFSVLQRTLESAIMHPLRPRAFPERPAVVERQASIKALSSSQTMAIRIPPELDFLRAELRTGIIFADFALLVGDKEERSRTVRNAMTAYSTALLFSCRVALSRAQRMEFAEGVNALRHRLVALGEMGENVRGRRLDDRIRRLSAIAEEVSHDSGVRQQITDQIKADISEYFEREKNPLYDTDRRRT